MFKYNISNFSREYFLKIIVKICAKSLIENMKWGLNFFLLSQSYASLKNHLFWNWFISKICSKGQGSFSKNYKDKGEVSPISVPCVPLLSRHITSLDFVKKILLRLRFRAYKESSGRNPNLFFRNIKKPKKLTQHFLKVKRSIYTWLYSYIWF